MRYTNFNPTMFFSYWILVWYIIYYFRFTNYNPIFALFFGFIFDFFMLCLLICKRARIKQIGYFSLTILFTKVLPIYSIRNNIIEQKDLLSFIYLFIMYNIWLYYNNINVYTFYKNVIYVIINSKNTESYKTPMFILFGKIEKLIGNLM
jgi:hypothetical protein